MLDRYAEHIERLLAELQASRSPDDEFQVCRIERSDDAMVVRDLGGQVLEIRLPVIHSAEDYATALHEVGHICGRYQGSGNGRTRERWAWQWAREHAIEWTAAMERDACRALTATQGDGNAT